MIDGTGNICRNLVPLAPGSDSLKQCGQPLAKKPMSPGRPEDPDDWEDCCAEHVYERSRSHDWVRHGALFVPPPHPAWSSHHSQSWTDAHSASHPSPQPRSFTHSGVCMVVEDVVERSKVNEVQEPCPSALYERIMRMP